MNLLQRFLTKNPCYQANLNRADVRYTNFQGTGPTGLMLHSVGCAQPSAEVFCKLWDREDYNGACVHAFIDAKTGAVWQTLPWNYRGWHCGGTGNNSHVGVEMCESGAIRYESGTKFTVLDRVTALADCTRAYQAAVELFATLCVQYKLDPKQAICSHKEGCNRGIATAHGDPEHYWLPGGRGEGHAEVPDWCAIGLHSGKRCRIPLPGSRRRRLVRRRPALGVGAPDSQRR